MSASSGGSWGRAKSFPLGSISVVSHKDHRQTKDLGRKQRPTSNGNRNDDEQIDVEESADVSYGLHERMVDSLEIAETGCKRVELNRRHEL
jgi:hypothetical protein